MASAPLSVSGFPCIAEATVAGVGIFVVATSKALLLLGLGIYFAFSPQWVARSP